MKLDIKQIARKLLELNHELRAQGFDSIKAIVFIDEETNNRVKFYLAFDRTYMSEKYVDPVKGDNKITLAGVELRFEKETSNFNVDYNRQIP